MRHFLFLIVAMFWFWTTTLQTHLYAQWISYPAIRTTPNYGPVVTDIEQHLSPGHPYRERDRIGWTHEGTHGVNSGLRNRYHQPGFYVLENRAYLLKEPQTTLALVARNVPESLRGRIYYTYCVGSQIYWNNQPSYLFDEWVAYTNGSIARRTFQLQGRRETTRYMLEMAIYSTCVARVSKSEDANLKEFLKWMWEHSMYLIDDSTPLDKLRSNSDASSLREFMRSYFGEEWTKTKLGF